MKSKKPEQKMPSELRKGAEEKLKAKTIPPKVMSDKESRQLSHELQVYQVELEMQNDELRKAQAEIEESRAKYSDLYDFAPVGYFTFDKHGLILEANLTAYLLFFSVCIQDRNTRARASDLQSARGLSNGMEETFG